jgi:2-(1,2-epoxy-1,2-dihydrophenyl)acetyl-CoA isomerase
MPVSTPGARSPARRPAAEPTGPTRRPPLSDSVLYDVLDGVATITFNRPDALNACTVEFKDALIAALDRARAADDVRAVVLTGAGRAFCGGQDLREHAEKLAAEDDTVLDTVREHYNVITLGIATLPKPVVAAVNGMAAGAGASFAFAADFRIASEKAAFLMAFAKVGLGADSGASWTLQRLVGYGRATAMLMLAEPITAEQALQMGLVNAIVPHEQLSAAAAELAGRLAKGPTLAHRAIKEALAYSAAHDLPSSLEKEAEYQVALGRTADHRNSTAAFVAKQAPVFEGR